MKLRELIYVHLPIIIKMQRRVMKKKVVKETIYFCSGKFYFH